MQATCRALTRTRFARSAQRAFGWREVVAPGTRGAWTFTCRPGCPRAPVKANDSAGTGTGRAIEWRRIVGGSAAVAVGVGPAKTKGAPPVSERAIRLHCGDRSIHPAGVATAVDVRKPGALLALAPTVNWHLRSSGPERSAIE